MYIFTEGKLDAVTFGTGSGGTLAGAIHTHTFTCNVRWNTDMLEHSVQEIHSLNGP